MNRFQGCSRGLKLTFSTEQILQSFVLRRTEQRAILRNSTSTAAAQNQEAARQSLFWLQARSRHSRSFQSVRRHQVHARVRLSGLREEVQVEAAPPPPPDGEARQGALQKNGLRESSRPQSQLPTTNQQQLLHHCLCRRGVFRGLRGQSRLWGIFCRRTRLLLRLTIRLDSRSCLEGLDFDFDGVYNF